ncbi:MAG: N-acetylmuramoyl-L-alanine amidase [Defluviitaleaceae bacterium]|nr:N-acetylmuramoyl-L-alanine amidase [Defluviitaleaceae bacterium]
MKKLMFLPILLCSFFFVDIVYAAPLFGKTIIIDAGHGEFDPGKVAARKTLEKDINLEIALKLQAILETNGAYVLMMRNEDEALGQTKDADMAGRRYLANISHADMLVSVHQNAFENSQPVGPMVFHYSEDSLELAKSIQDSLNNHLQRSGGRKPKQNKSYFILRTTTLPAVLVECGFLTNSWDLDSLRQEDYQKKVAFAIYEGILNYFDS